MPLQAHQCSFDPAVLLALEDGDESGGTRGSGELRGEPAGNDRRSGEVDRETTSCLEDLQFVDRRRGAIVR